MKKILLAVITLIFLFTLEPELISVDVEAQNTLSAAATTFEDVSLDYWAYSYIERLYNSGITKGCSESPPLYCPEDSVTRAQMAVFLERGIHGRDYQPPAVEGSTGFNDVPADHWAAAWIKQLALDGITTGCGNGNYCPEQAVTRAQMAVFLLRAAYGSEYEPPEIDDSTGFNDVSADHWAAAWIKQLAVQEITSGCGNGNYCPENPVTRAQMAVFLVRTFNLGTPHPIGELIYHKADDVIAYDWFSYVPTSLSKTEKSYMLIGGAFAAVPPTDNYNQITEIGRDVANSYIWTAEVEKFIYLLPIIPRPETNHVYAVAFDWKVFLNSSDPFVQRPDLKVNLMIEKLQSELRLDGYNVQEKIFVEGFSAGGMFAQRYALLHPERVQGVAAGQSGGSLILPEETYNGVKLEWPVGVFDFLTLVGKEFNQEAYKQIPHFIFIGDQDKYNSTLHGIGELWRTQEQIDFMNTTFGYEDTTRLKNECEFMINLGYNVTFKEYEGVGHSWTNEMRNDTYAFFDSIRVGLGNPPVHDPDPNPPSSTLPYLIDGYNSDWEGLEFINDVTGDSISNDTDITRYAYAQDNNYLDIFLETLDPITKNYAVLDIGLYLMDENNNKERYQLNVTSEGNFWGGNYPETWYRIPIAWAFWNDVVEIQIPKSAFVKTNDFVDIQVFYISLFTDVNGTWTCVDNVEMR